MKIINNDHKRIEEFELRKITFGSDKTATSIIIETKGNSHILDCRSGEMYLKTLSRFLYDPKFLYPKIDKNDNSSKIYILDDKNKIHEESQLSRIVHSSEYIACPEPHWSIYINNKEIHVKENPIGWLYEHLIILDI